MQKKLFLLLVLLATTIGAWADVVSSVSQLSNTKCYTVVTERGCWWADLTNNKPSYNGNITNPANVPNEDAYKFAIIKQGDHFFLYSLAAQKFIHPRYNFVDMMPTPLTIEDLGNSKMKMTSSNPAKAINIGGSQWTWDTWTTTDGGNTLTISEVGDFDPTAALAMLSTKVYTVSCGRGSWAVTSTNLTGNNASGILSNNQFALFTEGGNMYLYSVGAEKFVKSNGTLFDGKGDPITFNLTGDANYPYHFYFPLETQIYFNFQEGAGSILFNNWSGQDAGSKYQITPVADADVAAITAKATEVFYGSKTITYNIKIDGTTVATTTNEQKVGEAAALPSEYASKEYVTYSYSPTTIGVETEEVEVTATVGTLPFEVSADFASAHWYNIKIGANQRYVGWEASEPYHTHADDEATEVVRARDAYQWAFMGNPVTGIKVVNKHTGASYSLTSEGTGTSISGATNVPNTVLRSGNHYWDIHQNGGGFSLNLIGKSNYYINTHGGATGYFQIWQSSGARTDGGSRMTVADVPDLGTTITYNVSYGGSNVYTTTAPGVVGDELGALPSDVALDFVTISGHDASTTVTRDMTVNVSATWDGPFELSADYASAHWYDMAIRGTWYVTSDQTDESGALLTVNANALGLGEDAYHWTFVGDPWHIQVYNKAEANNFGYTSQQDQGVPTFESDTYYWTVGRSTSGIANSFVLNVPGTALFINQYGGAGGSLKFWNSTNNISDAGSAFTVFDIPTDFAEYATTEIKPYVTPTGYFTFTDAVKAAIGWQDSYETTCSFNTYKTMKLALQAIDMSDMSNFNLPQTGYYTLKNKNYSTYMTSESGTLYGNSSTATDAKQIVKLTKTGSDTYTIGLMGKYAPATVTQSTQVTANAIAGTYTVVIPTPGYAAFMIDTNLQYSALHCAGGGNIVGWTSVADASQWKVEDAESVLFSFGENGDGYATAYLPFPYTTPEGVAAYTGAVNESSVSLSAVEGTVPANTAVVLKGEAGATLNFTIAAEVDAISGNALLGSYDPVSGGEGVFALAKKNDVVGFYPVASTVSIPAGRAYFVRNSGVKAYTFVFDEDDATGITLSDSPLKGEIIYNIAGQRLNKAQRGINIINGKKVLK